MKQKLVLILTLTLLAKLSFSQIIDRYGINMGTSVSTQFWNYKSGCTSPIGIYKFGFQAFLQAEKKIGNLLAVRAETGYLQKGFKNNLTPVFSDGTTAPQSYDKVILHNLTMNLGLKIKPVRAAYSPYFFTGLRGDFMISYKDIEFVDPSTGVKLNVYKSKIENFNKFNSGGLIGLGIDIKDLIYFEIEYNPNFTKNLDNRELTVKDNCLGAKIGVNINKLID